jgi:hypothetical protein
LRHKLSDNTAATAFNRHQVTWNKPRRAQVHGGAPSNNTRNVEAMRLGFDGVGTKLKNRLAGNLSEALRLYELIH